MEQNDAMTLFKRAGAYLEGHFRLSSGLHSAGYLQSALVLQRPADAAALGQALAQKVRALKPDLVLSPALGGIVIGHEVARALGVRALFAERAGGALTLRRGFSIEPGERTLIVEDVFTTGGSTRETMEVARAAGGTIVAAAAIVDRSGGTIDFGVPGFSVMQLTVPTFDPDACPLCKDGIPVVKPGSRPG